MEEREQISLRQFIYIIFVSRIIVGLAYGSADIQKADMVISIILGFFLMIFIMEIFYAMMKAYPDKTYIQFSRIILGKLGFLISLCYVMYFLFRNCITLALFNSLITTTILPETPTAFISITFMMAVGYGASRGLETIGRVSEIVGVIIIIAVIIIFLLVYKDIDVHNFLPLLESGPMPAILGGINFSTRTMEIIFISIIAPCLKKESNIRKGYIISFMIVLVNFTIIVICIFGVFGTNQALSKTFPYFSLVRFANAFNFIERIQVIHIGVWVLGMYIKLAISIYIMALSISQIFNLKEFKLLILPLGLIMISMNQIFVLKYVDVRSFIGSTTDFDTSIIFEVAIPLIMIIVMKFKKYVFNRV